jgi:tRNA pseudouridine55 synthase
LVVVGAATRLSADLTGLDKSYAAEARLGVETDTFDPEGRIVAESEGWRELDEARVVAALADLQGRGVQEPPIFSAKKIGGEAAHRRVRRGESVALSPVPITIHELRLVEWAPPRLRFSVRCSSGTYVRALARDLGRALGVGAHLTSLRRTAVGGFVVEDSVQLDQLEEGADPPWITPARALSVAGLPQVVLEPADVFRLVRGQSVDVASTAVQPGLVAAIDREGLVAVAWAEDGTLRPRKVFRAAEVSP